MGKSTQYHPLLKDLGKGVGFFHLATQKKFMQNKYNFFLHEKSVPGNFFQSLLKFLIENCMVRILIFCIFMVIKVKQLFKVMSLFPINGVK